MITNRQIERLWHCRMYRRLAAELLVGRAERTPRLDSELGRSLHAASLAIIRMDELAQSFSPLFQKLVNVLLVGQDSDGGWGDVLTTALAIRALLCASPDERVIRRGLDYLANLQKPEGAWPAIPIRRTAADAFVTAFVLFQLGDEPRLHQTIRFDDAVQWLHQQESSLDEESSRLWRRTLLRRQIPQPMPASVGLWS